MLFFHKMPHLFGKRLLIILLYTSLSVVFFKNFSKNIASILYLLATWSPTKGHSYLNKTAAESSVKEQLLQALCLSGFISSLWTGKWMLPKRACLRVFYVWVLNYTSKVIILTSNLKPNRASNESSFFQTFCLTFYVFASLIFAIMLIICFECIVST